MSPSRAAAFPLMRTFRLTALIVPRLDGGLTNAVPGEAGASRSRGAHRLIRQGAKLVETVDDIIEEIAPQLARRGGARTEAPARVLPPNAGENTRRVFALLQDNPLQVDQVIERSGLAAAQVLQILLDLELLGFVRQSPGNLYAAQR